MTRPRGTTAAVLTVVAGVVLLGACGGGDGKPSRTNGDPVAAAQTRLAQVSKANIDIRFVANTGTAEKPGKDVGFELKGPFQLPKKDGELPVAHLTSTRLLGDRQIQTTFISTGSRAWVRSGDKTVELKGRQLDSLRGTTKGGGADLTALHLTKWFATRQVSTSGDTRTVRGTLDAPAAINDVLALAGSVGDGAPRPLEAKDEDRLRGLVRSSSVELLTAAEDDTPRHLHFDVRFAPEDRSKVAEVLPDLAGVGLSLDLTLHDVGKAVKVGAPNGS